MLVKRPIRVEGDIAYVPLTKSYTAIIDAEDAALVGQHNWCARESRHTFYAFRGAGSKGNQKFYRLHRELLKAPDNMFVDHINGDGLDNRKENLRLVGYSENAWNSQTPLTNTSGYKGIYWYKKASKWGAKIGKHSKQYFLGYYETKEEAYAAYCEASLHHHGEFSRLV